VPRVTARTKGSIALSLVAIVLGAATLRSGGEVLFGGPEARATAGDYVPFADGRLQQILAYPRGTRRNTFSLRPDGRLLVTVSLNAELLPRPVAYRMLFRRTR
jgi:hypothetical protein